MGVLNNLSHSVYANKDTGPKNKGGFLGGLGYLGEKLAVGAMQSIEGIWDYSAGGIADLFGADDWAEKQMNKDWFGDWYSHPDEWFNPEGGWKTAGDVAGGIGSSLPAIGAAALAAGITVATGGTASPVAVGLVSAAVAGLGAAGTATKEAYRESGELTGKEWGYGALVGGTEAAIEYATAGIGAGGGKAIKALGNIGRKGVTEAATETAKAAARKGLTSIVGKTVKHVGGDFLSEAAEEGIAEIMAPIYARMTYDPNAQNATAEEVAYAAFIGGLSGVIMGGTTSLISTGTDYVKNSREGAQVREQGAEAEVLRVTKEIAMAEQASPSGYTVFEQVLDVYQSAGGKPSNAQLGKLQVLTSAARVLPMTEQAAMQILSDPAAAVESYRATTGQDITAEQLTAGLPEDFAARVESAKTTEERQTVMKDLRHALSTNESLLNLSLASATGRMMVDAEAFADRTAAGRLASREEYEIFLEEASAQKKAEVAKILGAESLDTVSYEDFSNAMFDYAAEHAGEINEVRSMREAARAAAPNDKAAPAAVATTLADGVHRYGNIAIVKQGDNFRLYEYSTDSISRKMTAQEATTALQRLRRQEPAQITEEQSRAKAETVELDKWATDNLKGYNELTGREKRTVRSMVRRARALGISESDVKMCAQVSVRSGLRIEFRKSIDVNGYYDKVNSLIVLNPNAKHNASRMLIHELAHALYTTKRGQKLLDKYVKKMDADRAAEIRKRYGEAGLAEHAAEEIATHYAEDVLGNRATMERMLREEPTLGDKVLSFFKLAKTDYKGNERLSRAAGRLYNHFSKLFAEFSAQNRGGLTAEGMTGELKYSFSSISESFLGRVGTVEELESGEYKKTAKYRDYVDRCVGTMTQTIDGIDEAAARAEVEAGIDGIVKVAVAAKKAGYDITDVGEASREGRDSKGRRLFSSLEPNSDYFTSHDISTICDKRKSFTEIHDAIVAREEELGVPKGKRFFDDIGNYFTIHKILAEKGMTAPCHECYVESMRKNLAPMSGAFLSLVRETDENNKANRSMWNADGTPKKGNQALRKKLLEALAEEENPTITLDSLTDEMLSTSDGIATLRIEAPLIYEAFNYFYGQSKPKLPKTPVPFRFGELTALLTDDNNKVNKRLLDRIRSTGGFRLQSYSDFQIENFVDVLQVIFEAGTLGLNGHAYTKVPAFLQATDKTNLKRNISIFTYDAGDGDFRLDRYDSFPLPLDEIYRVAAADSTGNTGIIVVSQNAENSAWAMANPNIGYIIPYHKSGQSMKVARSREVRDGGQKFMGYANIKDHTRQQSEVWSTTTTVDGKAHKAGTKVSDPIVIYDFWDFDNADGLSQRDLLKKNLEAYIDRCVEAGYHPKFREYLMNNAAFIRKLVEYEHGFGNTTATADTVAFTYKGYTIPYGYAKLLGDFSMFDAEGNAVPIKRLSLAEYDFPAAEAFFADAASLRRTELLQQVANDGERDRYITGDRKDWTASQIQAELQATKTAIVEGVIRERYSKRDKNLRYSLGDGSPTITVGMSDAERAKILRKKKIVAPLYTGQADASIMREEANLHHHKIGVVKATLERMAEEFGIIGEEIDVEDVDVQVTLSKTNVGESLSKKATPVQMAKLLPILKQVVESSVGIESHTNRYYYDTDTVYFDNLLGGYIDGDEFVPVRFGLKHSVSGKATLYVVVDQNKIPVRNIEKTKKTEVLTTADPHKVGTSAARSAAYSISQIVPFVNSKDLLRYLPDDMLTEKQVEVKWEGIAETIQKTNDKNDKKYTEYISKGNIFAAQQMVLVAAKAAGYTHVGYHGTHAKPFTVFERGIAGIYLATNRKLAEDFATGFRGEVGTVYNLVAKIKNPFVVEEHIYSTVPYYYNIPTPTVMQEAGFSQSTVSTEEISHFAEDNGYDGVIIKGIREGADVYTDDIIVFDPNQVKSADSVTYDDNGDVIPLSKRFNRLNPDIRYSLPDADDAAALATLAATEGSVGARRAEYNPSRLKRVTDAAQRAYIEAVNAQAGIEWYLRKHGVSRAEAETKMQITRASRSQSQAMIGGGQYDIFSDNPEYMGKGLMQILEPARAWSEDKQILFQQYLLHQLNIDRMTLESRSTAALSTETAELQRLQAEIARKQKAVKTKTAERSAAKKAAKRAELAETIKRLEKHIKELEKEAEKIQKEIDAKTLKDMPVFGETDERATVTAEESRKVVAYLERTHPEMKGIAGELYKYLANLQTMRVQAGLITQETADLLAERYPHYVPAFRADKIGLASLMGKNAIELAQTIKRAKGGSSPINDVYESIAAQTEQLVRVGRTNMLLADIAAIGDTDNVHIVSEEMTGALDADMLSPELLNGNGQVTFYRDGKKVTMLVAEDIYQGLESLRKPSLDEYSVLEQVLGRAMQLFKSGVTSYNPFFTFRNFARDLQDAGINSRHPALFAKNITTGKAARLMLKNSSEWQEYRALGGFASTVFDGTLHELAGYAGFEPVFKMLESGKLTKKDLLKAYRSLPKAARRVLNGIENLNAFVEQMPRFAEYLASIEAGDSKAQALNNSAEVTTNFARSGRLTRRLNATVIPFLNASIQGFDKMFRNVSDVFTSKHIVGALASLLTKAILLGVAPAIINAALLDDDDDYEKLRDTDKENNILIKIGETSFLKIPRGRVASVIGGLYLRTKRFTEGDDKAFEGYLDNVTSQVTPIDSASRTIFSPIIDVTTNRTWYGGEIEGTEFDDTAPVDRYDETTGSLAIWLGRTANGIGLEWSPKKIQYFLDQYTGVVGDVVLPIGSKKERSGLLSNLTVDATVSNKLSQSFYDVYEQTEWDKSGGDEDAEILLRYLNTVTKSTRALNKQIDETRNSSLSSAAKYTAVRDTRKLINAEYAATSVTIPAMREAIRATAGIEDKDLRYITATRLAFGAETALMTESTSAYERLSPLNRIGISYDVLLDYRLAVKGVESDKDKYGDAIPGSKRKKVLAIINDLPISPKERLLLFAISGYSAKAGEIKGIANPKSTLSKTIASAKGLKKAEKIALAEACGLEVKNGVIKNK